MWAHPADAKLRRMLRVVVRGRCLPFLLDNLPHSLSQGRFRRDALATILTKLRPGSDRVEEERRVTVVERVVLESSEAKASLRKAYAEHYESLNPIVTAARDSRDAAMDLRPATAEATARQHRSRLRRSSALISINAAAIALNLFMAVRALSVWHVISRHRVVEWIQQAAPHMPVTMGAVRTLNVVTAPFRPFLTPLVRLARAGVTTITGVGGGGATGAVVPGQQSRHALSLRAQHPRRRFLQP